MSQATQAPPEGRYCDIVMKGGITSGVVYPRAIHEFSKHYYFKNIGGTSAGALAAAVAAAAEYLRRRTGDTSGFELLQGLPLALGAEVPGSRNSRLFCLFQPQPRTRRLFNILVYSLDAKSVSGQVANVLMAFLLAYWPAVLVSAAAALAVFFSYGWLAAVLFGLGAVVVTVGLWVYRDVTHHMVANDYGLCTGMTPAEGTIDALTPWMHQLIQQAAGRGPEDDPLTFGDLWTANPRQSDQDKIVDAKGPRAINLRMFTTNLTFGRPYIMPFEDKTSRLFYRQEELRKYVPESVMNWIITKSRPYAPSTETAREGWEPAQEKGKGLMEMPDPADFPIVLGARMSLSFPILFSAIPLWAIDYEPKKYSRGFTRCLFSDGGICSNFPMHLFDGLVPRWPTFGLDLEPELKFWRDEVYLPKHYDQGYGERTDRFDEVVSQHTECRGTGETEAYRKRVEDKDIPGPVAGFLGSILNVMQNWSDTTLCRMPGVRDRIARIRLSSKEGGLNLNMDKTLIEALAARGRMAALELIDRFAPGAGMKPAVGWDDQRWIRLQVFLHMLQKRLPAVSAAVLLDDGNVSSYEDLIDRATQQAPPGWERPLTAEAATSLKALLQCLVDFSEAFHANGMSSAFVSIPETELRIRPPL